jgi:hypothetical protein
VGQLLATMGTVLAPAPPAALERVRALSPGEVAWALELCAMDEGLVDEAVANLTAVHADEGALDVLARLLTHLESARGNPDAPSPIFDDPDDGPAHRRLLYAYLLALAVPDLVVQLEAEGVPGDVLDATLRSFSRHAQIHQRALGTFGINAGWWQLLTLRGELLDIGRLQYHRVRIARGTFSPSPWYDEAEATRRGPGFRPGDESVGLHIPEGLGLDPDTVAASLARASEVLPAVWPVAQRRLLTCSSWLLDDQLGEYLAPGSRILAFQRLFEMVPGGHDDDADTLYFIFRRTTASLDGLPQETTLQRAIVAHLRAGRHWQSRCGWRDLDGA